MTAFHQPRSVTRRQCGMALKPNAVREFLQTKLSLLNDFQLFTQCLSLLLQETKIRQEWAVGPSEQESRTRGPRVPARLIGFPSGQDV